MNQLILNREIKEFYQNNKDKYRLMLKYIAEFQLKYS